MYKKHNVTKTVERNCRYLQPRYLYQEMSSVLQKGIIPDWQYDVDSPVTLKHHINRSANIQNLVTGQCWIYWTCRNVEGGEGHRHIA